MADKKQHEPAHEHHGHHQGHGHAPGHAHGHGEHSAPPPIGYTMSFLRNWMVARTLMVCAELQLADVVGDGEKSSADIAAAAKTDPENTLRLLRGLVSAGFFEETKPGVFKNNANSLTVASNGPAHWPLRMMGLPGHTRGWESLGAAVKSGGNGFHEHFKSDYFTLCNKDPAESTAFNNAMTGLSRMSVPAVVQAMKAEWKDHKQIVDLGGGHGAFLLAIKAEHPSGELISADLPVVVKSAPADAASQGLKFAECDFLEGAAVVANADLVLLKHILHDWSDEKCHVILNNVRKNIKSSAKVWIVESVLPPIAKHEPVPQLRDYLMDLNMLAVAPGGRERTEAAWQQMAQKTGFKLNRIHKCEPTFYNVIEFLPI